MKMMMIWRMILTRRRAKTGLPRLTIFNRSKCPCCLKMRMMSIFWLRARLPTLIKGSIEVLCVRSQSSKRWRRLGCPQEWVLNLQRPKLWTRQRSSGKKSSSLQTISSSMDSLHLHHPKAFQNWWELLQRVNTAPLIAFLPIKIQASSTSNKSKILIKASQKTCKMLEYRTRGRNLCERVAWIRAPCCLKCAKKSCQSSI